MEEEDYQVNKLQLITKDSKRTWDVLNGMLGKKSKQIANYFDIDVQEIHDQEAIANEFCNYIIEHPRVYSK